MYEVIQREIPMLAKWLAERMPTQKSLRGEYIHKVLGERIFVGELWRIDERAISGGIALGLFIAFTPTVPLQMLLTAAFAILLRVNLPAALAACWVTNPITAVPIYALSFSLGRTIVGGMPDVLSAHGLPGSMSGYFKDALALVTGGVTLGAAAAIAGYLLVRMAWRIGSGSK